VFSVTDAEEAKRLLTLACSTNYAGQYVARELVEHQTLDNLQAFGDRLADIYDRYIKPPGPLAPTLT
jgi:hypothetical protein